MSKSPRISVIMPVYNAASYLHEAIESILNQTFGDFEFLIFNDASTDNSLAIIQSYNDARIKVINSPVNTGYVKHLNHGLDIASGEFIARMDADDISLPQRFEKQIKFFDDHPEIGVCGTLYEFFGSKTDTIKRPETHQAIFTYLLLFNSAIGHPTVMIRNNLLKKNSIRYQRSLLPAEDYALWVELAKITQLHNIQEVLLKYRIHENNESIVKRNQQIACADITRKNLISYITGLSLETDTNNIDMLLAFLKKGYERKIYSQAEIVLITSFISQTLKQPSLSQETLVRTFGPQLFLICYNSTQYGIWSYKKFTSNITYDPGTINTIKFIIRSIFRKPPLY